MSRHLNDSNLYDIIKIYEDTFKLKQKYSNHKSGHRYTLLSPGKIVFEVIIVPIIKNYNVYSYMSISLPLLNEDIIRSYHNVHLHNMLEFEDYIRSFEGTILSHGYLIQKVEEKPSNWVIPLEILN